MSGMGGVRSILRRLVERVTGNPWLRGPLLNPHPADIAMAHPNDLGGRCIILASYGRTGTNWIVRALNTYPDFFCTHAGFATEYDPVSKTARPPSELAHLEPLVSGMSVDEYFEYLIGYRRAKHYVSSHNFQVNTVAHKLRANPPRRRYVVVNITRHPVVQVRSFVNRRVYEWDELHLASARDHIYRILRETPISHLVRDMERDFGVSVEDYSNACFLASMWTIMIEADELKEPVPHVPMERLVSDPQYFSWFVRRITEGTSDVDADFIRQVFAEGSMNESQDGNPMLPHDIYARLPEWQRFCWRRLLQEKRLQERYNVVGYDFSFVR
jgi:hypothetical protein